MRGRLTDRRRNVLFLEASIAAGGRRPARNRPRAPSCLGGAAIREIEDGPQAGGGGRREERGARAGVRQPARAIRYEKLESLEVGVALSGTEIKSIRNGNLSLNEAFARFRDGELWLVNFTIPPYKEGSIFNHEPGRPRKLLLHKEQLERLVAPRRREGPDA